jgi:hypothetical protein
LEKWRAKEEERHKWSLTLKKVFFLNLPVHRVELSPREPFLEAWV